MLETKRDSLRDPSAGAALMAALPTAQGKILVGIINSIGDRGDAEAAGPMKRYVTDSDPIVADAAITAVGKDGFVGVYAAAGFRDLGRFLEYAPG